MKTENKITINNVIYSLLFLVFGIILLTNTDNLVSIASKVVGAILIIAGIVKTIVYIYMKGKEKDYSISNLLIGIFLLCFGILFISFSSTFSFVIRVLIGVWILFAGINRIIYAISVLSVDKRGFFIYLITSLVMFAVGVLLISGIFDKVVGLLIIIYSVTELIDYIYYKVTSKNYDTSVEVKSNKKSKKGKKGKVIDANIDED